MAFVKLHEGIVKSSIMCESIHVRLVWLLLLAIADRDGYVEGAPSALARMFNVTPEQLADAFRVLTSPDPESRSEAEDGRRLIQEGNHRWRVVNYLYYRRLQSEEQRREKTRERTRRWREQSAGDAGDACVTHGDACDANAEAEAEAEAYTSPPISSPSGRTRFTPPTVDEVRAHVTEKGYHFDPEAFVAYYESKGWKVGNSPMRSWKSACVTWEKRREQDAKPKQKRIYRGQDHAEFNPKF
jgi:hypothetical protein